PLGPGEALLAVNLHHMVADGWSMSILVREIAAFYAARREGRAPDLPELPLQYPDYALWQRRHSGDEELAAGLAYWRWQLAGSPGRLRLPLDRPRPPVRSSKGASCEH